MNSCRVLDRASRGQARRIMLDRASTRTQASWSSCWRFARDTVTMPTVKHPTVDSCPPASAPLVHRLQGLCRGVPQHLLHGRASRPGPGREEPGRRRDAAGGDRRVPGHLHPLGEPRSRRLLLCERHCPRVARRRPAPRPELGSARPLTAALPSPATLTSITSNCRTCEPHSPRVPASPGTAWVMFRSV